LPKQATILTLVLAVATLRAQQPAPIVQPGAPGHPSKTYTPETVDTSPRTPSDADIAFIRGMIMHHAQAVAMTNLLRTRAADPAVRALGSRIAVSQTDEMRYMRQWLQDRHIPLAGSHMDMDMGGMQMPDEMPPMPGMLTPQQMSTLAHATGPAFDHLFLTGMIQHHTGALTMVRDLFNTPGAGQDPQLFDFASDVDNTQQAEIDIMHGLLKKEKP
jgi:uncharacterized protein (DUF305 family)